MKNPTYQLTPRQAEVLEMLKLGLSNKEIAEKLCISVRTVDSHVLQILANTNKRSRLHLVTSLNQEQAEIIVDVCKTWTWRR